MNVLATTVLFGIISMVTLHTSMLHLSGSSPGKISDLPTNKMKINLLADVASSAATSSMPPTRMVPAKISDLPTNKMEKNLLADVASSAAASSMPPTRMVHSIPSLDAGHHGIGRPPSCIALTPELKTDFFCHGCRASITSLLKPSRKDTAEKQKCAQWLESEIKKEKNQHPANSSSMSRDYKHWATVYLKHDSSLPNQEMIKTCVPRCDPNACSPHEKTLRRVDEAAPRILAGVTPYLTSLPQNNRLPADLQSLANKEMHLAKRKTYLAEFNPSIVQIPTSQIPATLKDKGVVYLASFRVAFDHACTSQFHKLKRSRKKKSHLGLALLRDDLSIIVDVVVDINDANSQYRMEDFRLFVLKGQIYVTSYTEMVPMWLVPPPDDGGMNGNVPLVTKLEPVFTQSKVGSNSTMEVSMRTYSSCILIIDGKNINYYHDESTDHIMAELYAMGPKIVVDPEAHCPCNRMIEPRLNKCNVTREPEAVNATTVPPFASFGTSDQLQLAKNDIEEEEILTAKRGSACCASIQHQGRDLWLGVLHQKTRFKKIGLPGGMKPNHFFSSFYAFEKQSPYAAVAWSGKFCLGFASEEESRQNPFTGWNTNRLIYVDGETLDDCPAVHFVSGMSEDAKDQSKLIIAYGVNDCTPRMVTLDKSEIVRMLFPSSSPLPASTRMQAPQKRVPVRMTSSKNHSNRTQIHFDCTLQQSTSGEVLEQATVDFKA